MNSLRTLIKNYICLRVSASSLLRSIEPRMSCTYDQWCEFGSGTFPWIQNYLFQIRIAAKNSKFNSFKLVDLLFDWFYGKFFNIKKIEVGTGTFPGSLINHSGLTALFIRQYYDVEILLPGEQDPSPRLCGGHRGIQVQHIYFYISAKSRHTGIRKIFCM